MQTQRPDPLRAADLAKIHIAKKDLGLDDAAYIEMLRTATGMDDVESAAELNGFERLQVIQYCQRRGWKPTRKGKGTLSPTSADLPKAEKRQSAKIRALWITLHKAGQVHHGSEEALSRYVRRMTKGKALNADRLDSHQANVVIEALKGWAQRTNTNINIDQ